MENSQKDRKTNSNEQLIKANALRDMVGEQSLIDPTGWIEVPKDKLPYNGILYPENCRISILPCNAGLLKYFSTLDETSALSVQDALIYVVKNHVRIMVDKNFRDAENFIYEHDRLFFTLLVHQYSGSPTNLVIPCKTPSNKVQDENVTPQSLIFSEISDKGMTYLNTKKGLFEVKTNSYGVLNYKPLTIKQSLMLSEFVYKKVQSKVDDKDNIEQLFIQVAPFFITENNKDDADEIYKEYFRRTQDMRFASMLLLIMKEINIELKFEFTVIDNETKRPFQAPVTSLRGLKNIFIISDSASELQ